MLRSLGSRRAACATLLTQTGLLGAGRRTRGTADRDRARVSARARDQSALVRVDDGLRDYAASPLRRGLVGRGRGVAGRHLSGLACQPRSSSAGRCGRIDARGALIRVSCSRCSRPASDATGDRSAPTEPRARASASSAARPATVSRGRLRRGRSFFRRTMAAIRTTAPSGGISPGNLCAATGGTSVSS